MWWSMIFLGLFSGTFCMQLYAQNKIVYLVSPPRSLSVAFLRMMQARGDFHIMHEPSQLVYNITYSPLIVQNWYTADAYRSYEQVKRAIKCNAEQGNVFVKEMSFAVRDFHVHDFELMKQDNVYFVFLIRDPHHSIISLYKKIIHLFDDVSHQTFDIIGYKAVYELYAAAKEHAAHMPYIILTEDLYNNPHETVRSFCEYVGIEFDAKSLWWDDLGENFEGKKQWHEIKYKEQTHYWHHDAIRSTCFSKPMVYEVDKDGNPTFSEIANPMHRDKCKELYDEHMRYYNLMLKN